MREVPKFALPLYPSNVTVATGTSVLFVIRLAMVCELVATDLAEPQAVGLQPSGPKLAAVVRGTTRVVVSHLTPMSLGSPGTSLENRSVLELQASERCLKQQACGAGADPDPSHVDANSMSDWRCSYPYPHCCLPETRQQFSASWQLFRARKTMDRWVTSWWHSWSSLHRCQSIPLDLCEGKKERPRS